MDIKVDLSRRRAANMAALAIVDPDISSIISEASHGVVYIFDSANTQWKRYEAEGAVFIIESKKEPYFSLVILNRYNISSTSRQILPIF